MLISFLTSYVTSDHLSLSFIICNMGIKLMFVRMNEIVYVKGSASFLPRSSASDDDDEDTPTVPM